MDTLTLTLGNLNLDVAESWDYHSSKYLHLFWANSTKYVLVNISILAALLLADMLQLSTFAKNWLSNFFPNIFSE